MNNARFHKQLSDLVTEEFPDLRSWKGFIFWWLRAEGFDYSPISDQVKFTDGASDGGIDAVASSIRAINVDLATVVQSKFFHSSPKEKDLLRFIEAADALQGEEEGFYKWLATCREDLRQTYKYLYRIREKLRFVLITPARLKPRLVRLLSRSNILVHDRDYIQQLMSHDFSGKTPRVQEHSFSLDKRPTLLTSTTQASVYTFSIRVSELAKAYDNHGYRLFSGNIRFELGNTDTSKRVRRGIVDTLLENPIDFLVFHNGITIVASGMSKRGKIIKLLRPSIVNGAQSVSTFGSPALYQSVRRSKAYVLVKLICIHDAENLDSIETKIAFRSNNQNKVDPSDLMIDAYDLVKLERYLKSHNIFLERKKGAQGPPYCNNTVPKELFVQILAAVDSIAGLADTKRKQELFEREALKLFEKFNATASRRLEAAFWCTAYKIVNTYIKGLLQKKKRKRAGYAKFAVLAVMNGVIRKRRVKARLLRLHDRNLSTGYESLEEFMHSLARSAVNALLPISGIDKKNEAAFYKARESLKVGIPRAIRKVNGEYPIIVKKRLKGVI